LMEPLRRLAQPVSLQSGLPVEGIQRGAPEQAIGTNCELRKRVASDSN
jgi:hypothetical protein